jgi:hypothetical protein
MLLIALGIPPAVFSQQPRDDDTTEPWTSKDTLDRRNCFQKGLREELAYDLDQNHFLMGCKVSPLYDFERWAEGLGCGPKEPVEGLLFIHTAWAGSIDDTLHNKSSVRGDFKALLDSFLMTQDIRTSKFIFWWLGPQPDTLDPLEVTYSVHDSIEFRRANIKEMAVGTPIEGRDEILTMGARLKKSNKSKRPRQLANMFRTLALHKMGGVWIDTDTLIMRDMRPLLEYAGEFATQLAISVYYNNNFMGLRAGSPLGWFLLDIIAKTGLPPESKESPTTGQLMNKYPEKYCKYVTRSGGECYDIWYWNHGSIQLSVLENRGIVIVPTLFSDPGYQSCYAPYLMGWHGGLTMRGLNITELLEIIRGTFIIHTRAYNANKPLGFRSNFFRLYELFRKGAERGEPQAISAMPLGKRSQAEETEYDRIWAQRLTLTGVVNRPNVVEPPWYPRSSPRFRVALIPKLQPAHVLAMGRQKIKDLGQSFMVLLGSSHQTTATQRYWAWNPGPDGGYLRPWHPRPEKIYCLDGDPKGAYGPRAPEEVAVAVVVCTQKRRSQRWIHAAGRLVNVDSKLCLQLPKDAGNPHGMELAPCSVALNIAQQWDLKAHKDPDSPRFGMLNRNVDVVQPFLLE